MGKPGQKTLDNELKTMNTKLPLLPVVGKEEHQLFEKLVVGKEEHQLSYCTTRTPQF